MKTKITIISIQVDFLLFVLIKSETSIYNDAKTNICYMFVTYASINKMLHDRHYNIINMLLLSLIYIAPMLSIQFIYRPTSRDNWFENPRVGI